MITDNKTHTFTLEPLDVVIVKVEGGLKVVLCQNDGKHHHRIFTGSTCEVEAKKCYNRWNAMCGKSVPASPHYTPCITYRDETHKKEVSEAMAKMFESLPCRMNASERARREAANQAETIRLHKIRMLELSDEEIQKVQGGKQLEVIREVMKRAECTSVEANNAVRAAIEAKKSGKPSMNTAPAPDR